MISRILAALLLLISPLVIISCGEQGAEDTFSLDGSPQPPEISSEDADLVISGNTADGKNIYLDLDYIRQLPHVEVTTYYPFLDATYSFTGIPLLQFLRWLGMGENAQVVEIFARDGYSVIISLDAMARYGHILTYARDGELYSQIPDQGNRGPYALVIDVTDIPSDEYEVLRYQMTWWIERIVIK